MYKKKLHISKIFSNLVVTNIKLYNLVMCNLQTKFVKFLEICNQAKAQDFGYCVSQGNYFFGYKLHVPYGLSGVIHSYDFSKASVHDINYLNDIKPLYYDCSIFRDEGNIGAEVQLDLFETADIRLECPYRLNQKDRKTAFVPLAKARKRIETLFSQLTHPFLIIRNYAKEICGLFVQFVGKISAMTALQYINYINNKPIGRIKYELI